MNTFQNIKRFNLVHIYWAEGQTMESAYHSALAQYSKSFIGYQNQKEDLLRSLEKKKAEARERGGLESSLPGHLRKLPEKESQIKAYLSITDGWMSHVWWALVARRYNLTYTGDPVQYLMDVNTKKY